MIFDLFINFLESFTYCIFLAAYLKIQNKRMFILLATSLQLVLLTIGDIFGINGLWLTISIVCLIVFLLYFFNGKFLPEYIFVSILYSNFIILCSSCSVLLLDYMLTLSHTDPRLYYCIASVLSKGLQMFLTWVFFYLKVELASSFDIRKWGFLAILDFAITLSLIVVGHSYVTNKIGTHMIDVLMVLLFGIAILYRFTIYKLNKLNKESVENNKLAYKIKFNEHRLKLIESMKYEMDQTYHDLFYILYDMEYLIQSKDYTQLQKNVNQYKHLLAKGKLIVNTGNDIFDYLYAVKINELILRQIKVENTIFISKRSTYDDIKLINFITDFIDYFKVVKEIHINLSEVGNILLIKVIYTGGFLDERNLVLYFNNRAQENVSWSIKKQPLNVVNITINLDS